MSRALSVIFSFTLRDLAGSIFPVHRQREIMLSAKLFSFDVQCLSQFESWMIEAYLDQTSSPQRQDLYTTPIK